MRTLAAMLLLAPILLAQEPVNGGTPSDAGLKAPREREGFSFVVFGDRTGGRPDGLKVLDAAIRATNRLDPDFVMTVGDLVQGYNEAPRWIEQMREFKAHMSALSAPWYPVAGNHDVYGRGKDKAKGHVGLYKKHFGPLYYSFDYRWAHVICLFTDEKLGFRAPGTQDMSPLQLAWLKSDLAATKAKQVFVFVHHPRWLYQGTNWPEVHEALKSDGRVEAVVAGHIHTYRDDGERDGIRYLVLAVTGGNSGGLKEPGALQHFAHVKVRPEGFTMSVLPVGSVLGADLATGREVNALMRMMAGDWLSDDGTIAVGFKGPRESQIRIEVENPTLKRVAFELRVDAPRGFRVTPQETGGQLEPGKTFETTLKVHAPALGRRLPRVSLFTTLRVPLESRLVQPIHHRRDLAVRLTGVPDALTARGEENGVLVLDGKSALRLEVDLPETFTVECWVRGNKRGGRRALISNTERTGFGLWWSWDGEKIPYGIAGFLERPGERRGRYLFARGKTPWDWGEWAHLAFSHDGEAIRFFVNGTLQSLTATSGKRSRSGYPFYIGADPDRRGQATSFFAGALDEVRFSRIARYTQAFKPSAHHERDADTVALFHFDSDAGAFYADDSGRGNHAWPVGKPRIETTAR